MQLRLWAITAACVLSVLSAAPQNQAYAHDSQLNSVRSAQRKSRSGSNAARNAGRNSIAKGVKDMKHGRAHRNPSEVRTGAFEIVQGILGLLASAAAGGMADKDDTNGDNLLNGSDVQSFANCLVNGGAGCACADADGDAAADDEFGVNGDIASFVNKLLTGVTCPP